jgi:hypothetical protein
MIKKGLIPVSSDMGYRPSTSKHTSVIDSVNLLILSTSFNIKFRLREPTNLNLIELPLGSVPGLIGLAVILLL